MPCEIIEQWRFAVQAHRCRQGLRQLTADTAASVGRLAAPLTLQIAHVLAACARVR
jgi:hypothetical protein